MNSMKPLVLAAVTALSLGIVSCDKKGGSIGSIADSLKGKDAGSTAAAGGGQVAYEINGQKVSMDELYNANKGQFYELEKKKAELVRDLATDAYVKQFFTDLGKKEGKTVEEARKAYIDKNAQVTDKEVEETVARLAQHPNLVKLSDEEKKKTIRNYLEQSKGGKIISDLVDGAIKEKKLVISYQPPQEPRYNLPIVASDVVRYGPGPDDIKPMGCEGDKCAVTIVEYSEFECPFCGRVIPTTKRLLEKYKGKIRWVTRNFPLAFHPNARPAAIAALCAGEQGKYWHLYEIFFQNQQALSKDDIAKHAGAAGVDKAKFDACIASPAKYDTLIEEQMKVAQEVGVGGTPAFFINGRKISGALPYENFEQIIEEELKAPAQK